MSLTKSQDLVGRRVVNEGGFVLGAVTAVVIDTGHWQVTDLQICIEKSTAKEVGLKTPFFGNLLVLLEIELIKSAADQIVVRLSHDELKPYVEGRQDEEKEAEKQAKRAEKAARKAAKKAAKEAD